MARDNLLWLGLGGLAVYLLSKKSASTEAVAAAAPGSAQAALPPGYMLTAATTYDVSASLAAKDQGSCESAGGVWMTTGGVFGIGGQSFCTDPQKSSAACQKAGGTWLGSSCSFPGDAVL